MTSLQHRHNICGKIEEPNIIFRSIQISFSVEKLRQISEHTGFILLKSIILEFTNNQ